MKFSFSESKKLLFSTLLILIFLTSCEKQFKLGDCTFTAPPGTQTNILADPEKNGEDLETLIFARYRNAFMSISRQNAASEVDFQSIWLERLEKLDQPSAHFQLISQKEIDFSGWQALETIHREFHGEPYVQYRDIYLKQADWVYLLSCGISVDSTPGLEIPVAQACIDLAHGFSCAVN